MNINTHSSADAGTLDKDFGNAGIVQPSIPNIQENYTSINSIGIDSEHRLYLTGQSNRGNNSEFILGRLDAKGGPDSSFGNNGYVTGVFPGELSTVGNSIIFLEDGKFLLIGVTGIARTQPSLARFLPNGDVDRSFGTDGYVVIKVRPEGAQQTEDTQERLDEASASQVGSSNVTLQADGKILLVQTFVITHATDTRALMFRLNSDGTLDETFNGTGHLTVTHPEHPSASVKISGCMVDQDGKLLGCGALKGGSPNVFRALFVRYNTDGTPDTSFNGSGFVLITEPTTEDAHLVQMIQHRNNRILGIGISYSPQKQGVLISLDPDGRANIQFNQAKPLFTRLDDIDTFWTDGVMQPDGNIVISGTVQKSPQQGTEVVIARFVDNGEFDKTFNKQGWVRTQPDATKTFAHCVALQADGKIVAGGTISVNNTSITKPVVLRYHGKDLEARG